MWHLLQQRQEGLAQHTTGAAVHQLPETFSSDLGGAPGEPARRTCPCPAAPRATLAKISQAGWKTLPQYVVAMARSPLSNVAHLCAPSRYVSALE